VIVGIVGLLAGVTPLVVQRFLLPVSSSLEFDVALAGFLYLSVALSVLLVCLAIPRSQGRTLAALRAVFLILALALIVRQVSTSGWLAWARLVGPRALIIVPDGFSGVFGIYIKDILEPGLATAGKVYTYRVPENGALQADIGWIALRFSTRFGPYSTYIRWASGKSMPVPDCQWLTDTWLEPGPTTGHSMTKTLGIACRVGAGPLEYALSQEFFRRHFRMDGVHDRAFQQP